MHPGDIVLTNQGFHAIKAGLEEVQVALVMRSFLQGHDEFTESKVEAFHIAPDPCGAEPIRDAPVTWVLR